MFTLAYFFRRQQRLPAASDLLRGPEPEEEASRPPPQPSSPAPGSTSPSSAGAAPFQQQRGGLSAHRQRGWCFILLLKKI